MNPAAGAARPGPPRWRDRLDTRFVLLSLGLLLVIQTASFAFIRRAIDANARQSITVELQSAERVFHRLVDQLSERLTESSRILATDYGFRDAIGTGDQPTIDDALANQTARIGATLAIFVDNAMASRGTNAPDATRLIPMVDRIAATAARDEGQASGIVVLDGQATLLVVVQVKAPLPIGWVAMTFPIGKALLEDLFKLTSIHSTILARPDRTALSGTATAGSWIIDSTTQTGSRDAIEIADIVRAAPPVRDSDSVIDERIGDDLHRIAIHRLEGNQAASALLVLTRSIDEAIAPYRTLQWRLLALTLLGAALFGLGSFAMARRVTRPLQALSASAGKLGEGDYETPVAVLQGGEVGALSEGFESMRVAVRERDRRITRLAFTDELTGLPNRAGFVDALTRCLEEDAHASVMILDLDRFKKVNEVMGHQAGDRLLAVFATRLQEGTPDVDLIARFGGDEFAILVRGREAQTAESIAEHIRLMLESPMRVDEQTVDIGAGIGIAHFPAHGATAASLLASAELAMYEAKRRQQTVQIYHPALDTAGSTSLSMLSEIRRAIEADELELWLQPKVRLADGRLSAAEALVRWRHPERGLVPPMHFVPFLEQTGWIHLLTAWVLRQSTIASMVLRNQGLNLRIAVNLSARDLMDSDLPSKIERHLIESGLGADSLCLEITESAMMDDPDRALATLERLHRLGLSLSIDDFGTGYSSLAYLKRLPVSQLKIDRSFVMNMTKDPADAQIVRSTIDLAHNLGLSVVAEGVETEAEWAALKDMRCDEAQGYLISRPQPLLEFIGWALARARKDQGATKVVLPAETRLPAAVAVVTDA